MPTLTVKCPKCKKQSDVKVTNEVHNDAIYPYERHPDGSPVVDTPATKTKKAKYLKRPLTVDMACPECHQREKPLEVKASQP